MDSRATFVDWAIFYKNLGGSLPLFWTTSKIPKVWHPKSPKFYKFFSILQSIFLRILHHVITQNLVALKRIHEPTDKSWMPTVWRFLNSGICPSPEIGNKFQPSLILRVIIEDYIAEMARSNVEAFRIIRQLHMNHYFNVKYKNGVVPEVSHDSNCMRCVL